MLKHGRHARLADQGGVPMPMTPADFGKLIAQLGDIAVIARPTTCSDYREDAPTVAPQRQHHNAIPAASLGEVAPLGLGRDAAC